MEAVKQAGLGRVLLRGWGRQLSCGHRQEESNRQLSVRVCKKLPALGYLKHLPVLTCTVLPTQGYKTEQRLAFQVRPKTFTGLVLSPTRDLWLPSQLKNNPS